MSSNAKKTSSIRARKAKPNRGNRKADLKRIRTNSKILRELSDKNDK
jgi:hypothetical protein